MDLYVDTLTPTDRTALFSLRVQCTLKRGTPAAVPLFVYIYPENIRSVEVAYTPSALPGQQAVPGVDKFINLRFNMTRPASLVAPRHRRLQPKEQQSRALLDSLHSLVKVTVLSFFLDLSSLSTEVRTQLALLPAVFSATSRPTTRARRACLQQLYGGTGGCVINPSATDRETTPKEAQATPPGSPAQVTSDEREEGVRISTPIQTRKRSASAEESQQSPSAQRDDDDHLVAGGDSHPLRESPEHHASPSQASTQLDTPSSGRSKRPRLSQTPSALGSPVTLPALHPTTGHDALEQRVAHLESSIRHLSRSRSHAPSPHAQHDSQECHACRYNTSEASSIRRRIDDTIDDGLDAARSRLEDWTYVEVGDTVRAEVAAQLEELEQKLQTKWEESMRAEAIARVRDDVKDEFREEVAREVMRRIARGVGGSLQAYLRHDAERQQPGGLGGLAALFETNSTLSGESAALFVAVRDVNQRFAGELTEEEMARVMDHLEDSPLSAVKYNACAEEMKRYFVGKWKVRPAGTRGWR
ncbi:hypothetical protein B0T20DRAFT_427602 [Sordaria brevicollis]|uniref:Uncharacterized protein n=1 Tax=Sordaria brevicollis TaxID=83679 RepID=A0AAE0U0E1_SORBR|nr:hypothetical protein B0T20DRAFT_427602 [Sordaria brevicollis]